MRAIAGGSCRSGRVSSYAAVGADKDGRGDRCGSLSAAGCVGEVVNQPRNGSAREAATVARRCGRRVGGWVAAGRAGRARFMARRAVRAAAHMPRWPAHCKLRQLPWLSGWWATATSRASRHRSGSITSPGITASRLRRSRGMVKSLSSTVTSSGTDYWADGGHDRRSPLPRDQVVRSLRLSGWRREACCDGQLQLSLFSGSCHRG